LSARIRASSLLMDPVCGVVGADEVGGEEEAEAGVEVVGEVEVEMTLISSQAPLVHPKISLWMRRCCEFLRLRLLLLRGEQVLSLDLLMAVRSLFCVARSHFVRRQSFLALRILPERAARAERRRVASILIFGRRGWYMRGEVQGV
jgi:hypothetical protein